MFRGREGGCCGLCWWCGCRWRVQGWGWRWWCRGRRLPWWGWQRWAWWLLVVVGVYIQLRLVTQLLGWRPQDAGWAALSPTASHSILRNTVWSDHHHLTPSSTISHHLTSFPTSPTFSHSHIGYFHQHWGQWTENKQTSEGPFLKNILYLDLGKVSKKKETWTKLFIQKFW